MKLVRYNNELQPFGRLTAMRILLDKFSPPPEPYRDRETEREEETTTRDIRDEQSQNETNAPRENEPVAA